MYNLHRYKGSFLCLQFTSYIKHAEVIEFVIESIRFRSQISIRDMLFCLAQRLQSIIAMLHVGQSRQKL